jgi:SAM-dependent methyltransferase
VSDYLMAGQLSELDRLQLQSRVWEPAGERLLQQLGDGNGRRAVDVGCGCLGWLRLLSRWVGRQGEVVGTDIDDKLLGAAEAFAASEGLSNVRIVRDDLFASQLPASIFDLVHARFQIAPLGRGAEQLAAYQGPVSPGGRIVLEDPDSASWRFNPAAPGLERLIALILDAFRAAGGDFDAGRHEPGQLRMLGLDPRVRRVSTLLRQISSGITVS